MSEVGPPNVKSAIKFLVVAVPWIVIIAMRHYAVPPMIRGLGSATGHYPEALRVIGWLFAGLPWVIFGALVAIKPNPNARQLAFKVVGSWILANIIFLPARRVGTTTQPQDPISGMHYFHFSVETAMIAGLAAFLGLIPLMTVLRRFGSLEVGSWDFGLAVGAWYFGCLAVGAALVLGAPLVGINH